MREMTEVRRKKIVNGVEVVLATPFSDGDMAALAAKLEINNKAWRRYCRRHRTNGIPCDVVKTFPHADVANNENRSLVEVWQFCADPPDRCVIYVKRGNRNCGTATTWTGDFLGELVFGYTWTSNFGDRRSSFRMKGINGAKYAGVWCESAQDCATARRRRNGHEYSPFVEKPKSTIQSAF